jgi:hypothetical protein
MVYTQLFIFLPSWSRELGALTKTRETSTPSEGLSGRPLNADRMSRLEGSPVTNKADESISRKSKPCQHLVCTTAQASTLPLQGATRCPFPPLYKSPRPHLSVFGQKELALHDQSQHTPNNPAVSYCWAYGEMSLPAITQGVAQASGNMQSARTSN